MIPGKISSIRYESELAHQFRELLTQDIRLERLGIGIARSGDELAVTFDGATNRFKLKHLLTPTIADIPTPVLGASELPLLVVPKLSSLYLDACQQNQVSVADLNGRLFLRGKKLLIALPPIPGRKFRFELEPRNVFVGKSVRIVRSLLSDPERLWQQAELVKRTGATSGLVSRIVTYLTRQGSLKKVDARRFHVVSPLALLDAWAQADDFGRRTTTYRFSTLESDSIQLARKIRNALTHGGPHFAFTQWVAGWLRHPYAEPSIVSLYVPHLPTEDLLSSIGLRPVQEAGRVWFHVPSDEGVFRETRVVENLPLVCDAQIYVDLQKTGLRGPDQAQALREWPEFLRP